MQRVPPFVRIGWALVLLLVLAGCSSSSGEFDPTQWFYFNTKKKVPGDRQPVFPNGVPGVETGVPADLVKGYKPPPGQATESADAAAKPVVVSPATAPVVATVEKAKPKLRHKRKPRPKAAQAHPHEPVGNHKPGQPAQTNWPAPPSTAPAAQTNWPAPPSTAPAAQTNWPAPPSTAPAAQTNWPAPPSTAPAAQTNWPAPPSTAPAQAATPPSQPNWPNPPAAGTTSQ